MNINVHQLIKQTFLIFSLSTILGLILEPCNAQSNALDNSADDVLTPATAPAKITKLIKIDQKIGTGAEATPGTFVDVHYSGWLYDPKATDRHGTKFDSSLNSGHPFTFQLDARNVIRGWDMGIRGMKVGGKRTLIIPGYLAYGTKGSNSIPPNATLIFDVEVVDVK